MFMARTRPVLDEFTPDEIAIIDHIAEIICAKYTAASISHLSRNALWDEIDVGADIPVAAAAVIPGEVTIDDLEWAAGVVDADRSSA
jgi:hypothetical protein